MKHDPGGDLRMWLITGIRVSAFGLLALWPGVPSCGRRFSDHGWQPQSGAGAAVCVASGVVGYRHPGSGGPRGGAGRVAGVPATGVSVAGEEGVLAGGRREQGPWNRRNMTP